MIENHAGQFLIQPVFNIRRQRHLFPVVASDLPATHHAADFDIREKYGYSGTIFARPAYVL